MKWKKIKYKLKWFVIKTNLFKHTFNVEGFVYVDIFKNPVKHITDKIKWLRDVDIYCRYKDIDKKAIEAFHSLYPEYKGYINVF